LARVIHERRAEHGFLLTAWVFLPDHRHAILCPPYPLTISTAMGSVKDGATKRVGTVNAVLTMGFSHACVQSATARLGRGAR
jgi:REP element-mobilizing transposase RayT